MGQQNPRSLIVSSPGAIVPAAPAPPTRLRGRVRVKRVSYASLAKFGLVLGILGMALPGMACGVGALLLVRSARTYLEGIQPFTLTILNQNIATLDFVKILGLANVLERLRVLEAGGILAVLGITVAFALVGGLLACVAVLLIGLGYNILAWLTGGVELELGD